MQCTVTRSPGFQLRTAEPTRSNTPEASLPTTWYGWSWRAAQELSRARRAIGPNVETGSKMLDHTVLKLMLLAITARYTSSGASSGVGTSPTCRLLRGSFSLVGVPAHMSCSAFSTWTARYESGMARLAKSSADAPDWMASRISCMG